MSGLAASVPPRMRLLLRPAWLLLLVLVLALDCIASVAAPAKAEPSGRLVPRLVVALYDGGEEATVAQTRIHRFAEMPLNFLGYKLSFWDVRRGVPAVEEPEEIAAVISWFSRPIPASAAIHRWLNETSYRGARLIVLDEIGEGDDAEGTAAAAELLDRLGLRSAGSVEVTYRAKVAELDPDIVGFERAVVPPFAPYLKLAPTRGDVETHLALATGSRSDVIIATSTAGGYAGAGYTLFYEANLDRLQWVLNPFEFFRRALGQKRFPVPDTTTLSGRRLYFSHIDGDGWNNLSEVERYRGTGTTSAAVVLNELIAPYPDLPVSVGVIAGDVDETLSGSTAAAPLARKLFALPQVEVASHTYTHPFDWSFFEHYARASEVTLIERHFSDPRSAFQRSVDWMRSLAGKPLQNLAADRFVAFSAAMPRVYMRNPFDLGTEVGKALRLATSLAPEGKPAQLYLWSGEANPFEAALKATRLAGVESMNGGDSRYDAEFPSAAYVPPLARPVGSERQVYAAASNENTYTNDWKGPFFGFSLLSQTLERTERPRRLKPANIYYHMYSGEKPASLAAVRGQLDAARRARLASISSLPLPQDRRRLLLHAHRGDRAIIVADQRPGRAADRPPRRDRRPDRRHGVEQGRDRLDDKGWLALCRSRSRHCRRRRDDGTGLRLGGAQAPPGGQPLAPVAGPARAMPPHRHRPGLRPWRAYLRRPAARPPPHPPHTRGCRAPRVGCRCRHRRHARPRPPSARASAGQLGGHLPAAGAGMNRAGAWPILGAALAVLAASLIFIPGGEERTTMAMRDGRYEEAYGLLKDRDPARLDPDALLGLHRLAVHFGDLGEAASALESYVSARPGDSAALDARVSFYRQSQNETAYLLSLEAAVAAAPSKPRIAELLGAKRMRADVDGERTLLAKAVALGLASEGDMARGGLLLAATGRPGEALALLERLPASYFSTDRQPQLTQLSLLAEREEVARGTALALALLKADPSEARFEILLAALEASPAAARDFRAAAEPLLAAARQ